MGIGMAVSGGLNGESIERGGVDGGVKVLVRGSEKMGECGGV